MDLAYRKDPKSAPVFGLRSWIENDARKVAEMCGIPGCTECFKERMIYDDHRLDRQRTLDFIKANGSLLRPVSVDQQLTEEKLLFLPRRVYGFVLRSRKWKFLDIDSIHPLRRHSDGFRSLVLPEGHAFMVEGLVQMHSPHTKLGVDGTGPVQESYDDLVRGKGKGLIILLHGAPGVGKTSTAECVADYTRKPLFPITCGDIGETARLVLLSFPFSEVHAKPQGMVLDGPRGF